MASRIIYAATAALLLVTASGCTIIPAKWKPWQQDEAATSEASVAGAMRPLEIRATGKAHHEAPAAAAVSPYPADWQAVVEATGRGFPAAGAQGPMQREMSALQAAQYDAMARAVEGVRGAQVRRVAQVQDMTVARESVTIESSGQIAGARVIGQSYDKDTGLAEVRLAVGLDAEGNIVPDRRGTVAAPVKVVDDGRAKAVAAARSQAAAHLREQLGASMVDSATRVSDLELRSRAAAGMVESWLGRAQYSEPRWDDGAVEVEAVLTLNPSDYNDLAATAGDAP